MEKKLADLWKWWITITKQFIIIGTYKMNMNYSFNGLILNIIIRFKFTIIVKLNLFNKSVKKN